MCFWKWKIEIVGFYAIYFMTRKLSSITDFKSNTLMAKFLLVNEIESFYTVISEKFSNNVSNLMEQILSSFWNTFYHSLIGGTRIIDNSFLNFFLIISRLSAHYDPRIFLEVFKILILKPLRCNYKISQRAVY